MEDYRYDGAEQCSYNAGHDPVSQARSKGPAFGCLRALRRLRIRFGRRGIALVVESALELP